MASRDFFIQVFLRDTRYHVSPSGFVWSSVKGDQELKDHWRLCGCVSRKGTAKHPRSYLILGYMGQKLQIHRIVYAAFNETMDEHKVVNHIDGNTFNNSSSNLNQLTHQENIQDGWDRKRGVKKNPPFEGLTHAAL